jgi:phosphoribosylformylglycinamidine synthase
MRNEHLQYRCEWVHLLTQNTTSAWTAACEPGQILRIPISHGDGRYFAAAATLDDLERSGRVAFRYCTAEGEVTPEANPNGSIRNIAGVVNERGNVLGMMPHPENHVEDIMGCTDGRGLFAGLVAHLERAA